MADKTIHFDHNTDLDSEEVRGHIRMQAHITGYELVDYGYNGHEGRPYVTLRKRKVRQTAAPKARFF